MRGFVVTNLCPSGSGLTVETLTDTFWYSFFPLPCASGAPFLPPSFPIPMIRNLGEPLPLVTNPSNTPYQCALHPPQSHLSYFRSQSPTRKPVGLCSDCWAYYVQDYEEVVRQLVFTELRKVKTKENQTKLKPFGEN